MYGSPQLPIDPVRFARRKPRGLRRAFWRGFAVGYLTAVFVVAALVVTIVVFGPHASGRP